MPGRWVFVILLLLGAWQVVGSLIEKAGKKQQEQRLKNLADQRHRQMTTRTPTAPPTRSASERAEALAARRRAQLEQLRERRADRRTPGGLTAGPATGTGAAPAPPPSVARPSARAPQPLSFRTPPARRPAPPTRPPVRPSAPRRPQQTTARMAPPRPAAVRQVQPLPPEEESDTVRVVVDSASEPRHAPPRHPHLPRPIVAGEPLGPHALRQMVLYKEILEAPVSLRDHQVWERM